MKKVKLLLLNKKYERIKIPIIKEYPYEVSLTGRFDELTVLVDVTYFEKVIRLPKGIKPTYDEIKKVYDVWNERYIKIKKLIDDNNHRLAIKFESLWSGNSDDQSEAEAFRMKVLSEYKIGYSMSEYKLKVFHKWLRDNGFHKPLKNLKVGDIINIMIL